MSHTQDPNRPAALPLADLFREYLQRQVSAQEQGLGYPEPTDEVLPYDAVPVQPIDPALAWEEARSVLGLFPGLNLPPSLPVPPDWPQLVAGHEPAVSLAFCLGNFPQLVRNLQPLLMGGDLAALRPAAQRSQGSAPLLEWAGKQKEPLPLLLAAGTLRLAREFDRAAELLRQAAQAGPEWRKPLANEEAALAWHRGQGPDALALWQAQEETVPVLFNRGMASLFLGQPDAAREALAQAVAGLPDSSSWHHLGHLYLALA
jgi:tetratricopeptide (TPR) repeat protein